jgi:hypothetical protein
MDARSGTWNVRSLYKAGSLTTLAREIANCTLIVLGVEDCRGDRGDTEPAINYMFFYIKGTEGHRC